MLKHPCSLVSLSDAGAHLTFFNDAGFGLHLLGHWVRERGVLTLAEAVWRLCGQPAQLFGVKERGAPQARLPRRPAALRSGGRGPRAEAAPVRPCPGGHPRLTTCAVGVQGVWVNGVRVTGEDGPCDTKELPGRLLREFPRSASATRKTSFKQKALDVTGPRRRRQATASAQRLHIKCYPFKELHAGMDRAYEHYKAVLPTTTERGVPVLQKDGFFRNRRDEPFRQNQPAAPTTTTTPASTAPAPSTAPEQKVDQRKESKLVVGPDIKMKGVEITDCDTLVVEGRVEATLDSRVLEIAEHGVFQGTIAVDQAEIRGRFEGEITVRKMLVIQGTGKVSGKIRYARIKVEEGAELSGDLAVMDKSAAALGKRVANG